MLGGRKRGKISAAFYKGEGGVKGVTPFGARILVGPISQDCDGHLEAESANHLVSDPSVSGIPARLPLLFCD